MGVMVADLPLTWELEIDSGKAKEMSERRDESSGSYMKKFEVKVKLMK